MILLTVACLVLSAVLIYFVGVPKLAEFYEQATLDKLVNMIKERGAGIRVLVGADSLVCNINI